MKIAFIGQKGIPMTYGGVEKHVERLSVELVKRGHEVFVYTRPWYTPVDLVEFKGVKLISLPSWNRKNFDAITHAWRSTFDAMRRRFDIIHYHGVGPALLCWLPRLFAKRSRVLVTLHGLDRQHQKWSLFAKMMLWLGEWMANTFAHETIVVSKSLQLYCFHKYHNQTIYIPNGVDVHKKELVSDFIEEKWNLKPQKYFLFMSRLVKHKGAHYLIEAFNRLKTDFKLVIVGESAFTDEYVAKLKASAKNNHKIIFTGNVAGETQTWKELFSHASLFIQPSESEGFPIAVLDAMSFATPVLVSDIDANLEILGGGHGFSFENKSIRDLNDKMHYLINRPEMAMRVGQKAQEYVQENFSWTSVVSSTEKVYQTLLEKK